MRRRFGDDDLFFPPDEDVLEGVTEFVFAIQPFMNGVHIVQERDVEIGIQRLDLSMIVSVKEPVLPTERGVRIDDDVRFGCRSGQNVLENASTQSDQALTGKIQNSSRHDVGCLGVHEVAHMERPYVSP